MNTQLDLNLLNSQHLKGVGKRLAERLANLGIHSVQDLLFHLPHSYQDRTQLTPLRQVLPGDYAVIEGEIDDVMLPKLKKTRLLCRLNDGTGRISLRFFFVNAFQRQQLKKGTRLRCYGEVRRGLQGFEMFHPEYRVIEEGKTLPIEESLTPIYPTTEGLSQSMWQKLINQALSLLSEGKLHDILPSQILEKFTFPSLKEALLFVHRPPKNAPIHLLIEGKHVAQKRLGFEELLAHRLSLLHIKETYCSQKTFSFQKKLTLTQKFLQALPYKLTHAQKRVAEEIYQDLSQSYPMLRLVQGDVGSGKTVVAALAMLQAVENGYQAALAAPTELLIEQHFKTFKNWFDQLDIKVVLLTSQMKIAQRRQALEEIENGQVSIILGTHAIFQKAVKFSKLGLIVVDEQHRFGVEQRALFREKGIIGDQYPHQLIMTATPIPRTLAMSAYADLDLSIIDELPPGRTPVKTIVVSSTRRNEIMEKIREACVSGRQVYWVCTLIEESDALQCKTAENTAKELQEILKELKVGLVHGRLKSSEKEAVMTAFKNGALQVLVATTVIEVGVDVPNASLMVIENAERLGLAQLHQLRGRVGRGTVESHCVLIYETLSQMAKERLSVMRETTDGFKIAERDLEIRGPGEVLGTRQAGVLSLRVANLLRDSDLLPKVASAAEIFKQEYQELIQPLIKRWLGQKEKYGNI